MLGWVVILARRVVVNVGEEKEFDRGERKKIKKSFSWSTITVYICTVTVHFARYHVYLDIFTRTDVEGFWDKMCKLEHFLYFR